jgi:hypothetical protein
MRVKQVIGAIVLVAIAVTQIGGCSEDASNNYTPTRDCPGVSDPKAKC